MDPEVIIGPESRRDRLQGLPEKEAGLLPAHPSVVLNVKTTLSVCADVKDNVFASESLVHHSDR